MAQSIVNPDFKLDASGIYLWQYEDATRLHAILNGAEEFFRVFGLRPRLGEPTA